MKDGLHPVQKRLAFLHGSQCGFCTPGIVMSLYTILRSNPDATPHEIEESLDGNLCRCTGYRPILDAAKSLSNHKAPGGCCTGSSGKCPCAEAAARDVDSNLRPIVNSTECVIRNHQSLAEEMKVRELCEPIFPPALLNFRPSDLFVQMDNFSWFRPVTLSALVEYLSTNPHSKLLVGNTEVGIEVNFKGAKYLSYIHTKHVPELQAVIIEERGLRIGASVTLQRLQHVCRTLCEQRVHVPETRFCKAIDDMLKWFASNNIRNVASIGGNIVTASPISDMNPVLCACNAMLRIASKEQTREVPIRSFFKSYRVVDLKPGEVLVDIYIPFTENWEFVIPLKQARRREDDISIVTACISIKLAVSTDNTTTNSDDSRGEPAHWKIIESHFYFGGMAATTVAARKTSIMLHGRPWNQKSALDACDAISKELRLLETVPGGQGLYRTTLCASFLYRAYLNVSSQLHDAIKKSTGYKGLPAAPIIDPSELSAVESFLSLPKGGSRGEQKHTQRQGGMQKATPPNEHEPMGDANTKRAPVGQPLKHSSAEAQVCGAAQYTDDIPTPEGGLYSALVTSTQAHAKILSINGEKCAEVPGFVALFTAADVKGHIKFGQIVHDQELFAKDKVIHYGQIIGLVVARSHREALEAAKAVEVQYEVLPVLMSISDAIAANSFFHTDMSYTDGDIDARRAESDFVVEGTMNVGGQEHFYLEPHCCLVVPKDYCELEVYSSTQNANGVQLVCARACNLNASQVVCRVKRIGGGFGGKESAAAVFAGPVAVAAYALQQPVRLTVDRDLDMSISGQRHAYYATYKAGCSALGELKFMDIKLYGNAGSTMDLSEAVLSRAMFAIDGCYKWQSFHVEGFLCKTNQPSHTAFRGFGVPQGSVLVETVMEHLSTVSGIPAQDIRERNLYQDGDRTPYHMPIKEFVVAEGWEKLIASAEVSRRQSEIDRFNAENKWLKRGLAVLPGKFGIAYEFFLNQGGALIHVYIDGTVRLTHGGVEMGQGLHTKMRQIAARSLGIDIDLVFISEMATDLVPNASSTAASISTDLYGMAVLHACEQINARLANLKENNPTSSWQDIVNKAYFDRVNLSAQGFYRTPGIQDYVWSMEDQTKRGHPFVYFTQSVACSEVEVDCLTGDHTLLRSDILIDVGQSINPAIDIGQVEGGFMQGVGWCTTEELVWGDADHPWVRPGQLFTRGPGK